MIQLRKSADSGTPVIEFKTDFLSSVCLETPNPCKPTEYLKAYKNRNDYRT